VKQIATYDYGLLQMEFC